MVVYYHETVSCAKFSLLSSRTPKRGQGGLMSPPCLESQGCYLIPLYYFISCSSVYCHYSFCHFSAYRPILLTFSSQKILNIFQLKIGILVWLLFRS